MKRETVDELIARVMADHPGETPAVLRRYYEEVHQELAPLARALEAENTKLRAELAAKLNLTNVAPMPQRAGRATFTCLICANAYRAGSTPVTIWGESGSAFCRLCTPNCDRHADTAVPMAMTIEAAP